MKKDLTEVVFILDKSGSMSGLEKDVVGGFNSMLEKQKKLDGECLVSTVLFDNESRVVYDREDIREIRKMELEDYEPSGCTALIDALGDSIRYIRKVHKVIREEDRPEHTLFIITTDGQENASHRYSSNEVKKMVEQQQENGWEFIYLASNIDAVESSKAFGFRRKNVVDYMPDSAGNGMVFETACCAMEEMRSNGTVSGRSFDKIRQDFKKRSGK